MGIGVLLAIFGPLLLVPITWLLYRYAVRPVALRVLAPRVSAAGARRIALGLSIFLVGAALVVSHYPGKREFDQLCAEHATPVISDRVTAEGFYRTRLYPYEATRFLDSFLFVEAPDMYKKGVTVRYSKAGDDVRQEEAPSLRSLYGVQENFSQPASGITMTEKRIYEIATQRELARAASLNYNGGPLALLLGAYVMSSCPDILSEKGSRDFQTYYDLETVILRGSVAADK